MVAPAVNPLSQIDLPVTFESAAVNYTMTDFGGNTATVVVDPTDPTNMVAEVIKGASAQLWAGTTVSTPSGLASAIPFTATDSVMSVRVWSPDANIPVRLKVEDHTNSNIYVETEAITTVAGQWETLYFNFNNEVTGTTPINLANTYDMGSLFFDFGTDGATNGLKTYYFDDVQMDSICVATTSSITVTGLDVYTSPNGAIYTTTGMYVDTILNAAGCDSIISIDLTMTFTGLNEFEIGSFDVFPNPTSNNITISINENYLEYPIVIIDQGGRIMLENQLTDLNTKLNIATLENGLYYVKIGDLKAVKLIKQ